MDSPGLALWAWGTPGMSPIFGQLWQAVSPAPVLCAGAPVARGLSAARQILAVSLQLGFILSLFFQSPCSFSFQPFCPWKSVFFFYL